MVHSVYKLLEEKSERLVFGKLLFTTELMPIWILATKQTITFASSLRMWGMRRKKMG